MKTLFVIFLTIATVTLFGQQLDSCGLDNNPGINLYESNFLNSYLNDVRNSFDFSEKKIAFITGSSGSTIGTKMKYFRDVKKCRVNNSKVVTSLIILTSEEHLKSGGYDTIIAYWVKVSLSGKKRQKIVNKLKSGE